LQQDIGKHEYLNNMDVQFEDHTRLVLYPERFRWSSPKEAVWDWLMTDSTYDYAVWNSLFDEWFDSIGIACSS